MGCRVNGRRRRKVLLTAEVSVFPKKTRGVQGEGQSPCNIWKQAILNRSLHPNFHPILPKVTSGRILPLPFSRPHSCPSSMSDNFRFIRDDVV
ncbi:hypothetical protein CEXT_291871 [Caerostris extrusa]|uniref:Uncharacterized protein n=1 Tax=Caerostris extrusa TaxID=172846 RepID=A0AAV4YC84_CAEEX|nr:hypothetical protein CEXT_291871 [Caerostris extrusa]